MIDLTLAHGMYFFGTCLIILTMLYKQNIVLPSILITFFVGWIYSHSLIEGLQITFNASLVAAGELFNIFLIIAIMTALLQALQSIGSDKKMLVPFQKIMKNGHISFWVMIVVTYIISLFFWPTPAIPIVGALLIPVAIKSGLPPIGAAIAISLSGQGMALSSDYIIQIAPTLTATAAGADIEILANRAFVLSMITGIIAIGISYVSLKKTIKKPSTAHLINWEQHDLSETTSENKPTDSRETHPYATLFAFATPIVFFAVIAYMFVVTFSDATTSLQGGMGASLIGGVAFILLIIISLFQDFRTSFTLVGEKLVNGFLFAFKAMGAVIPVAGFFFMGSNEQFSKIISESAEDTPSFLFDIVILGQQFIPENSLFLGLSMLLIGAITGLDGSGFSGLPLVGTLSGALGEQMHIDVETLAAIGQMGSIWIGGGTLIAWSSLVAVAGFAKVPIMKLVQKAFFPVITGLIISTIIGLWLF